MCNLQEKKPSHRVFGKRIYHFPRVDSTNKIAFSLAEKGEREGTVVLADEQFEGEGRRGRKWFSPPGGLWFSLILRPSCLPECTFLYPLMGSVAVVKTIKKLSLSFACISWPNDVIIDGKKVAGVMCKIKMESKKVKFAILGVGVNLNIENFPSYLQTSSTSLLLKIQRMIPPFYFLDFLLGELEDLYHLSKKNHFLLVDRVQDFLPFKGRFIRLIFPGEEKVAFLKGIDYQGRLILELKDGGRELLAPGEAVSIIPKEF